MEEEKYLIDARELKKILNNKRDFSNWINRNIEKNKLIKNKDFNIKKEVKKLSTNTTIKFNYFLTKKAAKEIILSSKRNKIAQKIKEELNKGTELDLILEEIKLKKQLEIKIIKIEDKEYPEQLKKIKKPPDKLYVKGDISKLKEYGIAIIGTRYCTMYGRRMCKNFTNNLVGYDLNIISGLAKGIDTCAHKKCLEVKGKTIAVLPSGFNKVFPKENEELLNEILEKGGAVVTEYPEDIEKSPDTCRERNRIIAGLAIGTLVIEAGKNSGTSITARNTKEQGKKVFCVPSSLLNSKGIGTNRMIKNGEAKLVTEVQDIIKEFPELKLKKKIDFNFKKIEYNKTQKANKEDLKLNFEIEEENLEIYKCLNKIPKDVEEISQNLNKPINEVSYKLTLLELQGVIEELPGKKFKIK